LSLTGALWFLPGRPEAGTPSASKCKEMPILLLFQAPTIFVP
jgi:hypothetical protein